MSSQIDANQVINALLQEVGEKAQEIAMLKVQLTVALQNQKEEIEPEEAGELLEVREVNKNGSDTV